MAIPSQQIGWSQKAKLLWYIAKELEGLTKVLAGKATFTTTTTSSTTTAAPIPNLSLTVNNSSLFDIGVNSDFTIEWFEGLADDTNHPRAFSFGSYFTGGAAHALSIENGTIYWWVGGAIKISAPVTVVGSWNHFCIQRYNGVAQLYINGNSIGTISFADAIPTNGKPLYIGSEGDDSLSNALFSNFRWNNTTAVYDPAGFATPTANLTSVFGTTLLLFQGGTLVEELTDNSGMGNVITNGTGIYNPNNPFAEIGSVQFGIVP